jgi:glyoxylase-like metal-dependent hydrolase (beta-lactamase superfamily II)
MSWRLGIVEVGYIPQLPLNLYLPDAPPDELIDVPCYCYLASDGQRNVLVDSGPDQALSRAKGLDIVGDTSALLTTGLQTWGVRPSDIDCIVHTHLHHDHMQNDLMFPNAVVHVQRSELEWATGPDCGRFYVGIGALVAALGDRLHTLAGDAQLFSGLDVVLNGGHTPGHQSVILDTTENLVCLCGDIVSLLSNVEIIGPICPNISETRAFLDRAKSAGWEMVPSHDPQLRGHRCYVRTGRGEAAISSSVRKKV